MHSNRKIITAVRSRRERPESRGWRKYLDDPEETNRYIHQQNPEISLQSQAFGAEAMRPLCIDAATPPERLGRMTAARWRTLAEQLVDVGALESADPEPAYSLEFLTE